MDTLAGPIRPESESEDSTFNSETAESVEDENEGSEEMEDEEASNSVVIIDDEDEKNNRRQRKLADKENQPEISIISTDDEEDDFPTDLPKTIDHYMPLIFWHDKKPIMSIHVQPKMSENEDELRYKICTASVQKEVRVWEINFVKSKKLGAEETYELGVNFVANLVGHQTTLNMAKYSPDGRFIASSDVDGMMCIWKIEPRDSNFVLPAEKPLTDENAQFEIPPNKENWQRAFLPIRHDADVNCLVFSPCSTFICSAAMDDLYMTSTKNGRVIWQQRKVRRLICGLAWDPNGRYIATMSADRRLDILDAAKGYKLRTLYQVTLPKMIVDNHEYSQGNYKLFFDQHVITLTRSPEFSPCGELLFAPAGQMETSDVITYGTYVFRRCDLNSGLPFRFFPTNKPTLMVSVAPIKYELRTDTEDNVCGLPYRLLFAVMCPESILFYDSQTPEPIGFVCDITYDNLTSISWTPDGKVLAVSSMEAFNIFLHIRTDKLVPTNLRIERCASPPLKKLKDENAESKTPKSKSKVEAVESEPKTSMVVDMTADLVADPNSTKPKDEPKPKSKVRKIATSFTPHAEEKMEE